jgi:hypothetical protein
LRTNFTHRMIEFAIKTDDRYEIRTLVNASEVRGRLFDWVNNKRKEYDHKADSMDSHEMVGLIFADLSNDFYELIDEG